MTEPTHGLDVARAGPPSTDPTTPTTAVFGGRGGLGGDKTASSLVLAAAAVVLVTAAQWWFRLTNPTIVALTYLLIVLITAAASKLWVAIAVSVLADLCLNYFFMPPVGTLRIADPENWVALFVFLAVSGVASELSSAARARARDAMARRDELARLFGLSRDVLLTTDSQDAVAQVATSVARRFDLAFAAICLPRAGAWEVFPAGTLILHLDQQPLSRAFADSERPSDISAPARSGAGQRMVTLDGHPLCIVPLRAGPKAVGLLVVGGRPVEPGTLDALAGVAAIAIERAQFLDERKSAELARQSEELKSALLASLGHDLRTPLTAIRVAATNLRAAWLDETNRREQSDLVLAEVERLNRLFQNILEMARIDAGAVAAEFQWVHPSEIVEAARDQVEQTLRQHRLDVAAASDLLVHVDPRITASALAHLLENAAQYTPAGSVIGVNLSVSPEGLAIGVRDHGPGIAPSDLPHLFDRFYRGRDARRHASGTGMGLSIACRLLEAERGLIRVENPPDGGAQFTMLVPAETKPAAAVEHT